MAESSTKSLCRGVARSFGWIFSAVISQVHRRLYARLGHFGRHTGCDNSNPIYPSNQRSEFSASYSGRVFSHASHTYEILPHTPTRSCLTHLRDPASHNYEILPYIPTRSCLPSRRPLARPKKTPAPATSRQIQASTETQRVANSKITGQQAGEHPAEAQETGEPRTEPNEEGNALELVEGVAEEFDPPDPTNSEPSTSTNDSVEPTNQDPPFQTLQAEDTRRSAGQRAPRYFDVFVPERKREGPPDNDEVKWGLTATSSPTTTTRASWSSMSRHPTSKLQRIPYVEHCGLKVYKPNSLRWLQMGPGT